jgi:hypothetical protein
MPTFDALNITLSRRINDPVAAAATDGATYSSAMRIDYLNQAIRDWMEKEVLAQNFKALRDYTLEEAKSVASNVLTLVSWTGGIFKILDAYNVTDALPIAPLPDGFRFDLETGGNDYLTASATNQFWTADASAFRLIDGTTSSADSIKLRFIQQHTDLAAAGTILVPSQYHGDILSLAETRAFLDRPTPENVARALANQQKVDREVGAV